MIPLFHIRFLFIWKPFYGIIDHIGSYEANMDEQYGGLN